MSKPVKALAIVASVLLASLVSTVGLAYFTRWQVLSIAILVSLGSLVGLLTLVLALINLGLARVKASSRLATHGQRLFLVAVFLLLAQLVYLPAASAFRRQDVKRAQAFAEALIPQLEAYHQQHGTYPATLEAMGADTLPLPPLLQLYRESTHQNFYFLKDASYGFEFNLPGGFLDDLYHYCCGQSGTWTVTD